MAGVAALSILSGVGKIIGPALPWIAAVSVGIGIGVAYEHKAPWALGPRLDRQTASLPARDKASRDEGAKDQAAVDKPAFDAWKASLAQCQADRQSDAQAAGAALAKASTFTTTQASSAYRLGRATCGTSNAKASGSGAPGHSGGVRDSTDFRDLFGAGAYTPSGASPVPSGGP